MKLRKSASHVYFSWKNFLWITGIHILAFSLMVPFFSWQGLLVGVFCYYLTGLVGITFGFHRLLTHRSLKVPEWLENVVATCGTLALQGGPISWVAQHRLHHAFSDQEEDPHNASRGFFHSHIGFIFSRRQDLDDFEDYKHYAPDLARKGYLRFLDSNMIKIQVVFGLLLLTLGGLAGAGPGFDWQNAGSWVVWGVFVRAMVVYHVTWLVNSACHKWGTNPNNILDLSKNNWWVGLLAFGEGWHNNHHAQPRSARHGWEWWQLDQTWIFISVLKFFKLAGDVKLPEKRTPQEAPIAPIAPLATAHLAPVRPERTSLSVT